MGLDIQQNSGTLVKYSKLKSKTEDSYSRLEYAPETDNPDSDLGYELESGLSTLEKLTNILYYDRTFYTEPVS